MKILNTNETKDELIEKLKSRPIKNSLHILAMNPSKEELAYRDYIIKRCKEFNISYIYKVFDNNTKKEDIISYTKSFDSNDGFIVLLPFNRYDDLAYLRENIKLKDIDGFTYKSMAYAMNGYKEYLPATPKAIASFIEDNYQIKSSNIVIANSSILIGLPLANYLINKKATVTLLNKSTKDQKQYIKNADIFISAIGDALFYDKEYFKDGQIIIDVGTSLVNGKIRGDVDYEDLKDLDVDILTNKKGIGAITTLTLLQDLID